MLKRWKTLCDLKNHVCIFISHFRKIREKSHRHFKSQILDQINLSHDLSCLWCRGEHRGHVGTEPSCGTWTWCLMAGSDRPSARAPRPRLVLPPQILSIFGCRQQRRLGSTVHCSHVRCWQGTVVSLLSPFPGLLSCTCSGGRPPGGPR